MALHANVHGAFPIGCLGYRGDSSVTPAIVARFISWNVPLLPFLDEPAVAEALNLSLPSYHAANRPAAATVIPVFLCPSTEEVALRNERGAWKGAAFTDYAGVYGVEGPSRVEPDFTLTQKIREDSLGVMLYEVPVAPKQVADGLSRTVCIAETIVRRETETEWVNGQNIFAQDEATPINIRRNAGNEIGSPHPEGASLVFCDGHVEFVAATIDQPALNAILTKAGNEP
jgi:prepilin-type processing-associated H-X9-DG protein